MADFRELHKGRAGRLEKPAWGAIDPRANFARGFGSLHTRTKSGNGYVGENYYADCNNLIKYPRPLYLEVDGQHHYRLLLYPIYRRFYFDGQMSGRFELGFRTVWEIAEGLVRPGEFSASQISSIARQALSQEVRVHLQDGRIETLPLVKAMLALRDGWLLSSTKLSELMANDIDSTGSIYVGVGNPFVFVRSAGTSQVSKVAQVRSIFSDEQFDMFTMRSGLQKINMDVAALISFGGHHDEVAKERLARLFYTQIRTLTFAHSFYVNQSTLGHFTGSKGLETAINAMLKRFEGLQALEDKASDALTCEELKAILQSLDIDTRRMACEIEGQIERTWFGKKLSGLLGYLDSKADVAIGAAASTATKHLLSGGP